MNRPIIENRTCITCNIIFSVTSQNRTKKFCSRNCFDKNRNMGKIINCKNCNREKWYPAGRWRRNKSGRFFCSRKCSFDYLGNKMARYPVIYQTRRLYKYINWRTFVFERDNYTCQNCDIKGGILNVDHIIPLSFLFKQFKIKTLNEAIGCSALWDTDNGKTLCETCHKKTPTWGFKAFYYATI